MKKLLLALALCLLPTLASAQCAGVFQPNQVCGNNTAAPRPPFPISGITSIVQVPTTTTTGNIVTFGSGIGTTFSDQSSIVTSQTLATSALFAPSLNTSTVTTSTVNATTLNIPKISTPTIYTSTLYTSSINSTFYNGTPLTFPVSADIGGTGNTTLPANQLLVGEGTAPTSSVTSGTIGQYLANGPSFQSGPWTLLATLSPTTSGFVDTTHFTSAYNDYEFVFENAEAATTSNTCEILVQINGTFQTSGYLGQINYGNTTSTGATAPTTYIPCSVATGIPVGAPGIGGSMLLHNPSSTTNLKLWNGTLIMPNTSGIVVGTFGGWYNGNSATQPITGVEITLATSIFTSGQVKLYGRQ